MMEVYFISSSVLKSSSVKFYGTILKLNEKSERWQTTLLHRRKSKEAYQAKLPIKVDSRRIGQNFILYLKYKIHQENSVVMFVPVLCPVLTKVKQM